MLVTQRQAFKTLRSKTRRSIKWCDEQVKRLATEKDGERMKIFETELNALIATAMAPPVRTAPPKGIRPISAKKLAKIRSYA